MKLALVTGASEGIGRALATLLAKEGYSVTAVARNETRLKELISALGSGEHNYLVADLSTPEGVERISSEFSKKHYHLLINNAGFGVYAPFTEAPKEKLSEMTRTNIDALLSLSHAFLKKSEKGDALINVSSTLAFLPFPQSSTYAATKAFVTSLSESLWQEQKSRGVYVMNLCPGITTTQFHQRAGGNRKDLPKVLSQTAEQVAETAWSALQKRKSPTVFSGSKNFAMASLSRCLPRKTLVSLMGTQKPS